jgi:hypothetical protein
MVDETREGGCLCGAVRFRVALPSKWCAHCHCADCRRAHGAPFVTWFGVERPAFRVIAGDDALVRFRSSPQAVRSFCRRCGTTMLYEGDRWPDEVHVALACLEGQLDREPRAHVYWDRHVAWIDTMGSLPRLGGPAGNEPL